MNPNQNNNRGNGGNKRNVTAIVSFLLWALVLTLLFPIWFIAHCMSRLSHLGYIRLVCGDGVYYFTMIIHIIGLILGFLMLFSPLLTFTSIHYFASAYLILLGIDSMVTAMSPMGTRR